MGRWGLCKLKDKYPDSTGVRQAIIVVDGVIIGLHTTPKSVVGMEGIVLSSVRNILIAQMLANHRIYYQLHHRLVMDCVIIWLHTTPKSVVGTVEIVLSST